MGLSRAEKEQEILNERQRLNDGELVIITRNKGMTMKEVTTLRTDCRKNGASYKVTKNTLARRAAEGTKFETLKDMLTGPTGITISKDPLAAARVVYNFSKTSEKIEIVGGATSTEMLSLDKIKYLATLPSLDALRGKLVGLLQAPGAQIARVVNAYATKEQA